MFEIKILNRYNYFLAICALFLTFTFFVIIILIKSFSSWEVKIISNLDAKHLEEVIKEIKTEEYQPFYLLNIADLNNRLKALSYLTDITINYGLPNVVELHIVQLSPIAMFDNMNNYLDKDGVIFHDNNINNKKNNLPLLYSYFMNSKVLVHDFNMLKLTTDKLSLQIKKFVYLDEQVLFVNLFSNDLEDDFTIMDCKGMSSLDKFLKRNLLEKIAKINNHASINLCYNNAFTFTKPFYRKLKQKHIISNE